MRSIWPGIQLDDVNQVVWGLTLRFVADFFERLDTINGHTGPDILFGDSQADTLIGGNGNDTLYGGPGFDKCSGNLGSNDQAEAATCEQTPGVEVLF